MKPTIGRIVIYHVREWEKNINNGNDTAPAVVTAVWSDTCVNLKVLLDGPFDSWVTSSTQGEGPMEWSWPVIQKN